MITSWNDMPIGVFKAMAKIHRSQISDDDKVFQTAALLCGMEYDDFLNLPLNESRAIVAQMNFVYTEPKPEKIKRKYHLGATEYKMMKNPDEMTTAQYLNYQSIIGVPAEENMDDLMTIILVPDGKVYGDYDMEETKEEISNNLTVTEALGIANFFTASLEKSMRRMIMWSEAALTAKKILTRGKNKEQAQAEKIALQTAIEELHSMYGSLSSKR